MANDTHQVEHERLSFTNRAGQRLAAALERPAGAPSGFALFAHCFTCSKDIAAASRISRALAARGFGVVRFDFTGIGNSEGDFANTDFSSNVDDLVCAADQIRRTHQAPVLLIGHSLGGAAVLAAAGDIPECRAVATIGAPADPQHVSHLFADSIEEIEQRGRATVTLAGRQFEISREFLHDIASQRLSERIVKLRKALLVLHSPVDTLVGIDNAGAIFQAAKHPKSFISLDDADHLLTRRADSEYVAATIAAWAARYLPPSPLEPSSRPTVEPGAVHVRELDGRFTQELYTDHHRLLADEPTRVGGRDRGPSPYELLLAALGTCTSMTLRMYAERKMLALDRVEVRLRHRRIHAEDCADCETREGRIDHIERQLVIEGELDAAEVERLLDIADRCPVHRTLHGEIKIDTRRADA